MGGFMGGGGGGDQALNTTDSPTFAGLTIAGGLIVDPAENTAFFTLRATDYNTTYPGEGGAVGAWVETSHTGSGDSALTIAGGRPDTVYWRGYNMDPASSGQTRVNADEPGYSERLELNYYIQASGTLTASGMVESGGNTTVTVTTTPFSSGMAKNSALKFASSNAYPILTYNGTNEVIVKGDCSAESSSGIQLWHRQMEWFRVFVGPTDTAVRMFGAGFYPYNSTVSGFTMRAETFSFQTSASSVIFSTDSSSNFNVNAGSLYILTNNKFLYGISGAGGVAQTIGYSGGRIILGSVVSTGIQVSRGVLCGPNGGSQSTSNPETIGIGNSPTNGETGYIKFLASTSTAATNSVTLTTGSVHLAIEFASGEHRWGTGAWASLDTNLKRVGANILGTDDKFTAALGIGVGNSAAATTPGSVTKKIEVFDAAGSSLGFLAVYDGIS